MRHFRKSVTMLRFSAGAANATINTADLMMQVHGSSPGVIA
jgi:hypothetical protein